MILMKFNLLKLPILLLLFSMIFSVNITYAIPSNSSQSTNQNTKVTNSNANVRNFNSTTSEANSNIYNNSMQLQNTTQNTSQNNINSATNLTNTQKNNSTNNSSINNSATPTYDVPYPAYDSYENNLSNNVQSQSTYFDLNSLIINSIVSAAVLATVLCGIIWVKHKPVHLAKDANNYLDSNAINITNRYDHYVRTETKKTALNNYK